MKNKKLRENIVVECLRWCCTSFMDRHHPLWLTAPVCGCMCGQSPIIDCTGIARIGREWWVGVRIFDSDQSNTGKLISFDHKLLFGYWKNVCISPKITIDSLAKHYNSNYLESTEKDTVHYGLSSLDPGWEPFC